MGVKRNFGTFRTHPAVTVSTKFCDNAPARQRLISLVRRYVTNLRYADDIILLATSEAELQELVDRLDRVSRIYSPLINIDKTKVMASDGIACRILTHNEQLAQVNTFPYLGSLITEDGE